MIKRAFLSAIKNKARTMILVVTLFVIANLVLSSISIKSATEEAMIQARQSLGAEITLTVNTDGVFDYVRELMQETGTKPTREEIDALMGKIESGLAYEIAESEYVIDYNFNVESKAEPVDFDVVEVSSFVPSMAGETQISVNGTFNPLLLTAFGENGKLVLTDESSSFIGSDELVAIISYDLAYVNDLSIGDYITISSGDNLLELEIIGLFQDEDILTGSTSNTVNQIYIPLNDALRLSGSSIADDFEISSATYFLEDPIYIDSFIEKQKENFEEIEDGTLVFRDDIYEESIAPIEQVGSFSQVILIVVVIAAIIILTLIIVNTLKDRKYEIGVLMSLGEKKLKISAQYVFELLIVASIAFTISIGSSSLVSDYLGTSLLDMQLQDVEGDSDESLNQSPRMRPGSFGGGISNIDVEYIDEIDVSISIVDFGITLGLGMGIIIFSSIIPTIYITRFQPKSIFSSRN